MGGFGKKACSAGRPRCGRRGRRPRHAGARVLPWPAASSGAWVLAGQSIRRGRRRCGRRASFAKASAFAKATADKTAAKGTHALPGNRRCPPEGFRSQARGASCPASQEIESRLDGVSPYQISRLEVGTTGGSAPRVGGVFLLRQAFRLRQGFGGQDGGQAPCH